jgi:two-component system nitrogen regulation response regulator GlnG
MTMGRVARPPHQELEPFLNLLIEERLVTGGGNLYAETIRRIERLLIKLVLQRTGGSQRRAALLLGITRGCLRNKLRKLGITIARVVEGGDGEEFPP